MIYLHLAAPNDNNGNPRRLYMVLDESGDVIAVLDEGYRGRKAVLNHFPDAAEGPRIEITVSEYRAWLREAITIKLN